MGPNKYLTAKIPSFALMILFLFSFQVAAEIKDPGLAACHAALQSLPLTTARTKMRPMIASDFQKLLEMGTDPLVVSNMNVKVSPEVVSKFISDQLNEFLSGDIGDKIQLVITSRETDEVLGDILISVEESFAELLPQHKTPIIEVGISLLPHVWNQQIAGEIGVAAISYIFSHSNIESIATRISAANKRSLRAAKRVGFIDTGIRVPFIRVDASIEPIDEENSDFLLHIIDKAGFLTATLGK